MSLNIDKIIENTTPPAVSLFGLSFTAEAMTTGLNLLSAGIGILVAITGLYWSYLRIKLIKAELRKLQLQEKKDE